MGDLFFSIIWWGLVVWTFLTPDGYGPYVLLGVNAGDLVVTLYCGLRYGYLRKEGDFGLEKFVMTALAFVMLGGFYAGNLSFLPGTDAYNNALFLIFTSFWLTFGYRLLQYGVNHLASGRRLDTTINEEAIKALLDTRNKGQDAEPSSSGKVSDHSASEKNL